MPSWKINCLKSEDHTNPSVLTSTINDEANKIDSIPSAINHENGGKVKKVFFDKLFEISRCTQISRQGRHVRLREKYCG